MPIYIKKISQSINQFSGRGQNGEINVGTNLISRAEERLSPS